ncbi:MAG: hypothetical protein DYH13_07660 [Alphaproteobacteria bacterium PRO2]|nr:hypothetical protein [Alphaproteobacteria bacterium PRO2]
MESKDGDFSAIAWPGFVDILSTVIMMFLFFIMIVSIVMYVMSMQFKKDVAQQSQQKIVEQVNQELSKYAEMLESGEITLDQMKNQFEAQQEIQELSKDNVKLVKENTELSDAIEQIKADLAGNLTQTFSENQDGLVIFFERNDISLSPETTDQIKKYLETRIKGKDAGKFYVTLMAGDNPNAPTISVSRELGLARTLNIRNIALNLNIPHNNISVKYTEPKEIDKSNNWVVIKVVEEP